jgi:hypothetical protein
MSFAFNFNDEDVDMTNTNTSSTAKPGHLPRTPSITILDEPTDESAGKAPPEAKVKIERISDMVCSLSLCDCVAMCELQCDPLELHLKLVPYSWSPTTESSYEEVSQDIVYKKKTAWKHNCKREQNIFKSVMQRASFDRKY